MLATGTEPIRSGRLSGAPNAPPCVRRTIATPPPYSGHAITASPAPFIATLGEFPVFTPSGLWTIAPAVPVGSMSV